MSDYLAVGGVSAVLKSLLLNALNTGGPSSILGATGSGITNLAPDLIATGDTEPPQLNLFMYYASINPALRNLELPSISADGTRLSNPPLSLNLHYLVTAYGSNPYDPEILMGWAMSVMHNNPVVPRATIQDALQNLVATLPVPAEVSLVAGSTLSSQIEHIRITPETLSTEEIYRLWSAFQAHYRPTTSYQVSVVVIQDTESYKSNLPVQRRSVLAQPLIGPVIESVTPPMAASGQMITLTGNNFLGDSVADTLVSFNAAAGIAASMVNSTTLQVTVPTTLEAGVRSVRVLRNVVFPSSATRHSAFASNPFPMQVIPVIQPPPLPAKPPVTVAAGGALTLTLTPAVAAIQTVVVYIADQALTVPARPVTGPPSSADIVVNVPAAIAPGTYPLRVEVDGAQSKLTRDTNSASSTYNQWLPQVEVTA